MKKFFLPISIVLIFLSLAFLYVGIFTGDKLFWVTLALTFSVIAGILAVLAPDPYGDRMKTTSFRTVSVDQILEDCPHAIEYFNCGDFNVSWGDASYTLVDQTLFLGMLEDAGLSLDDLNAEQTPLDMEMKIVYNRLDELGDSTYIALRG